MSSIRFLQPITGFGINYPCIPVGSYNGGLTESEHHFSLIQPTPNDQPYHKPSAHYNRLTQRSVIRAADIGRQG